MSGQDGSGVVDVSRLVWRLAADGDAVHVRSPNTLPVIGDAGLIVDALAHLVVPGTSELRAMPTASGRIRVELVGGRTPDRAAQSLAAALGGAVGADAGSPPLTWIEFPAQAA